MRISCFDFGQNLEKYSLLDISLAARGEWSVTPDGATKQPTHFPPGSCYMFDPDLYGGNSWEKLKGMLTKVGCVMGCSVVIRDSCQKKTIKWKATYLLCCSHGLLVEENSLIEYDGDNFGPSNVVKEHLKRVKTTGHSKKGKKEICVPPVCCIKIVYTHFGIHQFYFNQIV